MILALLLQPANGRIVPQNLNAVPPTAETTSFHLVVMIGAVIALFFLWRISHHLVEIKDELKMLADKASALKNPKIP